MAQVLSDIYILSCVVNLEDMKWLQKANHLSSFIINVLCVQTVKHLAKTACMHANQANACHMSFSFPSQANACLAEFSYLLHRPPNQRMYSSSPPFKPMHVFLVSYRPSSASSCRSKRFLSVISVFDSIHLQSPSFSLLIKALDLCLFQR